MINRFCLVNCRFHVKEKEKLIIQGYYQERGEVPNHPVFTLDYELLDYETEVRRIPLPPGANRSATGVYHFYMIRLPENFEEYKELRCIQYDRNDVGESFHIMTGWLQSQKEKKEIHIDEAIYRGRKFLIRGWCMGDDRTSIMVHTDPEGHAFALGKSSRVERIDVLRVCPDCKEEDVYGFEIEGDFVQKKLWCVIYTGEGRTIRKVFLQKEGTGRRRQHIREVGRKAGIFYRQFGMQKTLIRAWEKMTKKDTISYKSWCMAHQPGRRELEKQKRKVFEDGPSFAIVTPVYRTPKEYLDVMIQSVISQSYSNWHLYLSDGSGPDSPVRQWLSEYEKKDKRITVIHNDRRLGIVENTNEALKMVREDFIVFADHDDSLTPDALYECACVIDRKPDTEIIFSDEDKMTQDGKEYYMPHFKADFNIDMLRSANYMCHLYVVKKTILDKVGLLNRDYEGSQDYDFILRCVEQTPKIEHIAKVLYHWRAHPDSTAGNPESKKYAYEAGQRAIEDHLKRCGEQAEVSPILPGFYRIKYSLRSNPLVSIIIPNKDHVEDLKRCLSSLSEYNTYHNIEILIIENNSEEKETFVFYEKIQKDIPEVRIITWDHEFNYSAIHNMAVSGAKGEYILFLNNDTEFVSEGTVEELLSFAERDGVGITGARLLYPDGTLQHGGVIVGLGGVAGHAFQGAEKENVGYFARICCAQEYSAVTGACMMVRKEAFERVDGMDENLPVAFNDVDLCLRVRARGYRVLYNPFAIMTHYESKTRGPEDTPKKQERFQKEVSYFMKIWAEYLETGDPYYNPNLTLDRQDFSLSF